MVQKSVELPGNQVIVDATSTNRLLVVVTDIGYTYKYQFDRDTELSRILEGDSVTKIASHEDVFSFVAKKRPEAAQYMVENALPTF